MYRRTAIHCKFDHIGRRTDGRLTQLLIHQGKYDLIHIEAIDQAVEGLQGSAIHLKEGIGLRINGNLEIVIDDRFRNESAAIGIGEVGNLDLVDAGCRLSGIGSWWQVIQQIDLIVILHPCQLNRGTIVHRKFDHKGGCTSGWLSQLRIHQSQDNLIHIKAIDQAIVRKKGYCVHFKEDIRGGVESDLHIEGIGTASIGIPYTSKESISTQGIVSINAQGLCTLTEFILQTVDQVIILVIIADIEHWFIALDDIPHCQFPSSCIVVAIHPANGIPIIIETDRQIIGIQKEGILFKISAVQACGNNEALDIQIIVWLLRVEAQFESIGEISTKAFPANHISGRNQGGIAHDGHPSVFGQGLVYVPGVKVHTVGYPVSQSTGIKFGMIGS